MSTDADAAVQTDGRLQRLRRMVVKHGLMLGGLLHEQRQEALGFVWAGLPRQPVDEPAINRALQAQLAGPAACLDTDHVELRRWLVDTGWLARDGFGREYRRVPLDALPAALQAIGVELDAVDTAAWAADARAQHAQQRAARQRAWAGRPRGEPA